MSACLAVCRFVCVCSAPSTYRSLFFIQHSTETHATIHLCRGRECVRSEFQFHATFLAKTSRYLCPNYTFCSFSARPKRARAVNIFTSHARVFAVCRRPNVYSCARDVLHRNDSNNGATTIPSTQTPTPHQQRKPQNSLQSSAIAPCTSSHGHLWLRTI